MRDFWEVTVCDFTKELWIRNFRMIFPNFDDVKSFLCSFSQIAKHPPNASPKTYLRYMSVFFPKWTCLHQSYLYLQFEGYWTGARWRPDVSQRCFSDVFSNRLLVNETAHRKSNKNCGRRLPSFPPVCSLMGRKGQSMAAGNVWELSGEYGS